MKPQYHDENFWIVMVFALPGGIAVVVWLLRSFRYRKTLCPEELGRQAHWTIFPLTLNMDGYNFTGPFSRVSLYDDMLVIRALGHSAILRRADILGQPVLRGPWIVLQVRAGCAVSDLRLSTDANRHVMEQIEEWRNQSG